MSDYEKEIWKIQFDEIGYVSKSDNQSFGMFCPVLDIHNGKEEIARRLVACLNACAGYKTEHLENLVLVGDTVLNRIKQNVKELNLAEKERDELLAALQEIGKMTFDEWSCGAIAKDIAINAISKAEANNE